MRACVYGALGELSVGLPLALRGGLRGCMDTFLKGAVITLPSYAAVIEIR
jgi:hypothetical protein